MKPYFSFQWHITDECDQRCKHCYIFSGEGCKKLVSMTWKHFNKKDHLWTLYEYETGQFQLPKNAENGMIYGGCNCGNCHITISSNGDIMACRRATNSKVANIFEDRLADAFCMMENMILQATELGIASCIISRGYETFDSEEGHALMIKWGVPKGYACQGFVILGMIDGEQPHSKPRKPGRITIIE